MSRVEVRRALQASPAEVFDAWTKPELIRAWMSPVGTASAEVDLRVGGSFRLVMSGEGTTIEHTGEYLEVDPPSRLKFTWKSQFTGEEPSVVTVEMLPRGSGTDLLVIHDRLPLTAITSHDSGWVRMLERLEQELS
jgi:uncharacterized protein YndB with AHSA1/START domain